MGLLLSCTHLHGENNSPQSAFYTGRRGNIWNDTVTDTACYFALTPKEFNIKECTRYPFKIIGIIHLF